MGAPSRFRLMADLIESRLPVNSKIADVAGGKGQLQAELYRRGFGSVISWDTRPKYAGPRRMYQHALFDYRSAPRGYDAVIGMHPDQGTDHIIAYAAKHRVPFIVCPCCILPSAAKFEGIGFLAWISHLTAKAISAGFIIEQTELPMAGRNIVLAGAKP